MAENGELSQREREILQLVATGVSNKEIARKLYISTNTVKVHLRNIFAKIGASSRTEAAMYGISSGLVGGVPNGILETQVVETGEVAFSIIERTWRVRRRSFYLISGFVILILLAGMVGGYILVRSAIGNTNRILDPAPTTGWQESARMEQGRAGFAVAAYEDKIYVIGGEITQGVTDIVERYSPGIDRWEALTRKPTAVSDINAVVLGGKIFVPGGNLISGIPTNQMEVYDPNTDTWQSGASLPRLISGYALVSFEGKMYLIGGWDGYRYLDEIIEYDPNTTQWKEVKKMHVARAHAGAAVIGSRIYIFGGFDGENALGSGEIFSPDVSGGELEIWDMGVPRFAGRFGMGVAEIADIIYVIGGEGEVGEDQEAVAYFHQLNEWRSIPAPVVQLGRHSQLVSVGNFLYLLGGYVNGVPSDRGYFYQAVYTVSVPLIIK